MTLKHLNGIKVLEFTQTVMGPTAGLILAELGADELQNLILLAAEGAEEQQHASHLRE